MELCFNFFLDRKRSTTSNLHIHNRHVDIEGHIPRSSTYQPPEAASSPPYYMDQPSRLAPCSSTIAEQARMYTVGEILGTRPPVSNVDLNLLRDAVNGRPRSATENRRRSIDSHAQNGIPQRSPPPTRPRSIPAPSLSRSPAPAPAAKVGNIDKRSPTHRRGDLRANSDVVIRKPRVFSHLMKRSETMAMAENGGARGGNRWMANGRGRSHAGKRGAFWDRSPRDCSLNIMPTFSCQSESFHCPRHISCHNAQVHVFHASFRRHQVRHRTPSRTFPLSTA